MEYLRKMKREALDYYKQTGDRTARAEMRKIDKKIKKILERGV